MRPLNPTDTQLRTDPREWLKVIEDDYLSDYLKQGGSAVKVISGDGETLNEVVLQVRRMAETHNYLYAHLDPDELNENEKKPDLHRIDKFFFRLTREVDWKQWIAAQVRQYLESRGIRVRDGRELNDLEGIAADNGRNTSDLINEFQNRFATPIIEDRRMTLQFRSALTALSRAALKPDVITPTTEEVLLEWLAGRTVPGGASALKKVHIFERINQSNARAILASFCHWLPTTGRAGLIVVLDFRPYERKKTRASERRALSEYQLREAIERGASKEELLAMLPDEYAEPVMTYSEKAYMQMLSLIRRFIDEIDRFTHFMLVILTTPGYYDMDSPRHYFDYDALQTRIGLEMHDAHRANPTASLVHLGGAL